MCRSRTTRKAKLLPASPPWSGPDFHSPVASCTPECASLGWDFQPRLPTFLEESAMHEELRSFMAKYDFSRREFVVTSLATGFALAVQPVSAQTITTDTQGI